VYRVIFHPIFFLSLLENDRERESIGLFTLGLITSFFFCFVFFLFFHGQTESGNSLGERTRENIQHLPTQLTKLLYYNQGSPRRSFAGVFSSAWQVRRKWCG
jgi:hypothetical protein